MKRIVIDEDLCQGTRECAAIAPEVVRFDATGIAVTTDADVVDDEVAERLVDTCPSMAIEALDP